jgi:hypothetical protein
LETHDHIYMRVTCILLPIQWIVVSTLGWHICSVSKVTGYNVMDWPRPSRVPLYLSESAVALGGILEFDWLVTHYVKLFSHFFLILYHYFICFPPQIFCQRSHQHLQLHGRVTWDIISTVHCFGAERNLLLPFFIWCHGVSGKCRDG